MPKVFPLQSDFSSGELSPLLLGRTNTERYQSGVLKMENFIPLSQGPATLRDGSEYVATAKNAAPDEVRLITFALSLAETYVLEFGKDYIRFYDDDGAIISGTPVEVAKPAGFADFSNDDLQNLQFALDTDGEKMYFVDGSHQVSVLAYTSRTSWAWTEVTFTNEPSSWNTTPPAAIAIHDGRAWYGRGSELWATEVDQLETFTAASAVDDDSLNFKIREGGDIQWISAPKDLLIGTGKAEYIVTSPEGYLGFTTNIRIIPQSRYGSMRLQAVPIGNAVLYISPDKRRMRAMYYQFFEDGWISDNLTWPSEHITAGGVAEMAYAPLPEPIVWIIDEDGLLISCSYDREQRIVGWARHPTTGTTIALTSATTSNGSSAWIAVERTNGVFVEQVRTTEQHYLDAHVDLALGSPQTSVSSGISHLEGETVAIIGDGSYQGTQVVASGTVPLEPAATNVVIGLPYTGTIMTMPLEGAVQGGTMQAMWKRWNKIITRLVESIFPLVNGSRAPSTAGDKIMDAAVSLSTSDVEITNLGVDRQGIVTVTQDLPFKTTVAALFGEVDAEIYE